LGFNLIFSPILLFFFCDDLTNRRTFLRS
jgi:hypothetical protein